MIYELKNFGGGISDFSDRGIPGAFKFASNCDIRKDVDSLSCGQALIDEGLHSSASSSSSISPSSSISASPSLSESASNSPSPSTSLSPSGSPSISVSPSPSPTPSHSESPSPSLAPGASVFRDLILFFVKCKDGYTYGFGNGGYIYRRDADHFWIQMYKDPEGINGACEWYNDGGQTWLYWATFGGKLHRKLIPGRNDWNDVDEANGVITGDTWPKLNLEATDWHTMREAGGSLIIANGKFLALVGYDDSYTNEALDLIPGNIAKTIVERNGRTIAGTSRASDPNASINGAIDAEVPIAQVGNNGELIFANMSDTVPIKRFPGGGKVNPGGVTNEQEQAVFFEWEQTALSWIDKQAVGNMALFGVFNASAGRNGIYTYGRRNKNKPLVMNLEYALEVDNIGAIVNVNGITLASYKLGSDFGVKAVDPTRKAVATYEGLELSRTNPKLIGEIIPYKYVELIMAPLPLGASVQFHYLLNKTSPFIQAKTADGVDNFTTANAKKAVFRIGAEAEIYEPKVVLIPTGNLTPEIYKIRTFLS